MFKDLNFKRSYARFKFLQILEADGVWLSEILC